MRRAALPALCAQLGLQILVVVYLAVEHDGESAAGVGFGLFDDRRGGRGVLVGACAHHGLVSVFEIDKREAAVSERYAAIEILAFAVGAAMGHDVAHCLQGESIAFVSAGKAADAAHVVCSSQSNGIGISATTHLSGTISVCRAIQPKAHSARLPLAATLFDEAPAMRV